ncbi:MAG: alpha/beta hydrolase [Acidimicrobiia bacterium]|nr:alpha/beta hydrolase [Acidimicrobiia bacterium]
MASPLRLPVADGISLAADAYGSPADPPVVLFHGGGQTRHSWDNTARALGAAGWYSMTVDLRGHGESEWSPDGNYHLERFAADIVAVCDGLSAPPALVGASLGGIASLLAIGEADHPIAAGLVLVDVAPRVEPAGVERIRAFMRQGLDGFASLEEAADAIQTYNPHRSRPSDLSGLKKNLRLHDDGRWHWHWDPRFMGLRPTAGEGGIDGLPNERFVPHERLEAAATRVTIPTLIVRGMQSDLLSEEGAAHLRSLIPHARQVDVAGAGHMVAGDRNDRFNVAVVDFLDTVVPAPAPPS